MGIKPASLQTARAPSLKQPAARPATVSPPSRRPLGVISVLVVTCRPPTRPSPAREEGGREGRSLWSPPPLAGGQGGGMSRNHQKRWSHPPRGFAAAWLRWTGEDGHPEHLARLPARFARDRLDGPPSRVVVIASVESSPSLKRFRPAPSPNPPGPPGRPFRPSPDPASPPKDGSRAAASVGCEWSPPPMFWNKNKQPATPPVPDVWLGRLIDGASTSPPSTRPTGNRCPRSPTGGHAGST